MEAQPYIKLRMPVHGVLYACVWYSCVFRVTAIYLSEKIPWK